MSNSLAIAAATRGLCAKLSEALAGSAAPSVGARVTSLRPNALSATDAAVNVFLFQVSPNVALRNADLPTRRGSGELIQRPQLALDLHFLLTFTGDEGELIPQRIMGIVLPALHAQPVLSSDELVSLAQTNSPSYLDDADLAQQLELVRFSLGAMNLEELSKLWSVFFQTQYLLSVPLQASLVLLEAPLSPSPSGRVRERGIFTGTPSAPSVASLVPAFTPLRRDGAAARIRLRGAELQDAGTLVRFGAAEPVAPTSLGATELEVALPLDLRAGMHPVSVVVRHVFEQAGQAQTFGLESRPVPLAVLPRIVSSSPLPLAARVLELAVEPAVGRTQSVRFTLERRAPTFRRIALPWTAPAAEPGTEPATAFSTLRLPLPLDLEAGRYAVQVEVDGVASGLESAHDELPVVEVV